MNIFGSSFWDYLYELHQLGILCDIQLCLSTPAGHVAVPAHKLVLVASTLCFRELLTADGCLDDVYNLEGVTVDDLTAVLSYIYRQCNWDELMKNPGPAAAAIDLRILQHDADSSHINNIYQGVAVDCTEMKKITRQPKESRIYLSGTSMDDDQRLANGDDVKCTVTTLSANMLQKSSMESSELPVATSAASIAGKLCGEVGTSSQVLSCGTASHGNGIVQDAVSSTVKECKDGSAADGTDSETVDDTAFVANIENDNVVVESVSDFCSESELQSVCSAIKSQQTETSQTCTETEIVSEDNNVHGSAMQLSNTSTLEIDSVSTNKMKTNCNGRLHSSVENSMDYHESCSDLDLEMDSSENYLYSQTEAVSDQNFLLSVGDDGPFICTVCVPQRHFKNSTGFRNHAVWKHSSNVVKRDDADGYQCTMCDVKLRSYAALSLHMRRCHNVVQEHRCEHCSASFNKLRLLQSHLSSAHLISSFKCADCDACFKSREGWRIHMQKQHSAGDPAQMCSACGKVFKMRAELRSHIRTTHAPERNYICDLCQRAFKHRPGLKRHLMTYHSKERRFHCDICSSKFKTHSDLVNHRRLHLREVNPLPADGEFRGAQHRAAVSSCSCEHCGKVFKSHIRCMWHERRVHGTSQSIVERRHSSASHRMLPSTSSLRQDVSSQQESFVIESVSTGTEISQDCVSGFKSESL